MPKKMCCDPLIDYSKRMITFLHIISIKITENENKTKRLNWIMKQTEESVLKFLGFPAMLCVDSLITAPLVVLSARKLSTLND